MPVEVILGPLRRGSSDPTYARRDGAIWRGLRTPAGTATLAIRLDAVGSVVATAWGDGADWALDQLPAMLGGLDDPGDFAPHPALAMAHRLHPHWRVPRSGLVFEALVAAVLEQKVTGMEAWTGWRRLVRRYGEPAPGPAGQWGLRVVPSPQTVRAIPSWEWLRLHVDGARSQVVCRAAQLAPSLERTLEQSPAEAERALRSLPGIGVWTAAEVMQRAHGYADAVSFGDFHLASSVGFALVGEAVDDEQMASLFAPYRPHRYRLQRLVELSGTRAPRHGPKMAPRRHLPGSRR